SPLIDAGNITDYEEATNRSLSGDEMDLAGNPRVYDFAGGGIIDMGAYEFQGDPPVTISRGPGNILYVDQSVDQSAPGYTGAGNSWANAIPELADALKWGNDNKSQWTAGN